MRSVSLADKYEQNLDRIYLTGIQALVRLLLVQKQRDAAAGLRTAGFVSGYRGSPLAGLDKELWRATQLLESHRIHFSPGVNEDLAATAVWGSQQVALHASSEVQGVFGLWYGKAPGVDRSGDALRHANAAGTSRHGGVLLVAGDDHLCKSSTLPSQSEFALMDAGIPILNPCGVQEVLDYGLHGWALSRFTGLWAGMIALADTMDSSAVVYADCNRVLPIFPEIELPPGGLGYLPSRSPLEQEALLLEHRIPAARAYARANKLNDIVFDSPSARYGIVTVGKAHLDTRQALRDLGMTPETARELGLRVMKVGMPWPLEPSSLREFASGLEEILVIEEKRSFVETQLKECLYGTANAPRIVGKQDDRGLALLNAAGDFTPGKLSRVLAKRLPQAFQTDALRAHLQQLEEREHAVAHRDPSQVRAPLFCSGCPHNRSTALPEGSRGMAGIGCHYMVRWLDRETETFSQMGGEGAQWIGQAPFSEDSHIFANLGDGTYFHSGILAIRAAVGAGVNITYKILFNDAVAMTGGQPVDGPLSVPQLTQQLAAEGVSRIAVVSDNPKRFASRAGLARGTTVDSRDALDAIQRKLREIPGCSVLIYDQPCAAELRRKRKRGRAVDPPKRVFINSAVCEGCGDCTQISNCVSVEPLDTALGRKRSINQSSCNKDYSCADGLCPAFVSIEGAELRTYPNALERGATAQLPDPEPASLTKPCSILITGIGGTGVVTVGALLGMAAHLEEHASTVLDMTGLAQKGGAVTSHIRIAREPESLHTPRIATAGADVVLACDALVATQQSEMLRMSPQRTRVVANSEVAPTADFVHDTSFELDSDSILRRLDEQSASIDTLDAGALARWAVGDGIAANLIVLGFALQRGLLPVRRAALQEAIRLNGVSVERCLRALDLGRMAAHAPEQIQIPAAELPQQPETLDEIIEHRVELLSQYQNAAYAERFRSLVERVRQAEREAVPGADELARAVALSYSKLLAYKDEYEVARLYTLPGFKRDLEREFDGHYRVRLKLAPPLWAKRDAATGRPVKREYGRWIFGAMKLLKHFKILRGSKLDVFGYTRERREERALILHFEQTVERLLDELNPACHALAAEIAALPMQIRGFDVVKRKRIADVQRIEAEMLERMTKPEVPSEPLIDLPLLDS